ncbi:MAG: hypothetical protein KC414_14905 [Romboutsia sp.]|nr:hypothetical protein [Romboutsia sp.]
MSKGKKISNRATSENSHEELIKKLIQSIHEKPEPFEAFARRYERERIKLFHEENRELFQLRKRDIKWILDNREKYGLAILLVTLLQIIVVFVFIIIGVCYGNEYILDFLNIIVPTVVLESLGLVYIVISKLFSTVDYKPYLKESFTNKINKV